MNLFPMFALIKENYEKEQINMFLQIGMPGANIEIATGVKSVSCQQLN